MKGVKKSFIVLLFTLIAAVCFCFAASLGVNRKAQARTVTTFKTDGVSVRLVSPDGLRFTTYVNDGYIAELNATYGAGNYEFGTLMIPSALSGGALTADTEQVLDVPRTVWGENSEGYKTFNAALVGIPESFYGVNITARAYVKPIGGAYIYSESSLENSLARVASYALNDGVENDKLYDYVNAAITAVTVDSAIDLAVEQTEEITLTTAPAGYRAVWASSDTSVATVDQNGVVSAVSVGVATITATVGNISDSCIVTVTEEQVLVPTSDEYFTFTLKNDDTYEIAAKDVNDMPAEVILPSTYNNKAVTSIGSGAFCDCSSLTSVVIPDNVISIGYSAFLNCGSLEEVTIGNSVIDIGDYAFQYCSDLTRVTIGNGVISIGIGAFNRCSSLEIVTIHDSVTSIRDGAFSECNNLQYNEYDNGYYLGNSNNPYVVFVKAKSTDITSCTINDNTHCICEKAFELCGHLITIIIPNNVMGIGDWAFSYCYHLTSINVSENNSTYKSIDGNLYSKDGTELIQYAIGKIATEFTIPDSVTSIGNGAFALCSSLTSITIPDSVTSIGNSAFNGCDRLKSITIPDSVTSIGGGAFAGCSKLTSINIPDAVTSIGSNAFSGCSFIESANGLNYVGKWLISVDNAITSATIKDGTVGIANSAFSYRSSLTSITIPDSVTSIANYAFDNCQWLANVTIGNGVTSIGDYAFYWCVRLTSITFDGSKAQWQAISKGYAWKDNVPATVVHCTDGDIAI